MAEKQQIDVIIKMHKWGWIGHILRKDESLVARQPMQWNPLDDDNEKENAQTMNPKLCHRFTLRINKQYFTSLKLSFGIQVNIF